jgi:molybdopterin synthase sulfur carrier subunit
VRIVYCGRLQDAAGLRVAEVDPPTEIATARALRDWLTRDDPLLGEALRAPTVRIVVNDEMVGDDAPISPGDEVAFMPPVSGG